MKNLKTLFLVQAAMFGLCSAQQEPTEDIRVRLLAHELYNNACFCAQASEEDLNSREALIRFNNKDLTLERWYAAVRYQINGENAATKTAQNDALGVCGEYLKRLERNERYLKFMVEDLKAGYLTEGEFFKDAELVNAYNKFNSAELQKLSAEEFNSYLKSTLFLMDRLTKFESLNQKTE